MKKTIVVLVFLAVLAGIYCFDGWLVSKVVDALPTGFEEWRRLVKAVLWLLAIFITGAFGLRLAVFCASFTDWIFKVKAAIKMEKDIKSGKIPRPKSKWQQRIDDMQQEHAKRRQN